MEETQGYVASIYERPPTYWFQLVMLLSDGDVLKHLAIKRQPLYLSLAYADARAMNARKEQEAMKQHHSNNHEDYDAGY